jgi:hypothetical protein
MAKKDKDTIVERGKGVSFLGNIPNVTDGLKKIDEFQNKEADKSPTISEAIPTTDETNDTNITNNSNSESDKSNENNESKSKRKEKNYFINFRSKVSNIERFNRLHLQLFIDTKSSYYYYRVNLFRLLLEEQKAVFEAEGNFVKAPKSNIIANKGRQFKSIETTKYVAFGGYKDDTRELLRDICYSFICLDNGENIDMYSIDYFWGLILDRFCTRNVYKELVHKISNRKI